MFKKIVSNLPYSPALVGQLGFYAKRLRKEEATRRAGLIVTAFALVAQSFAVFQPPEAANAANPSNFVNGGVSSINEYLGYYDRNHQNMKDLYTSLGITRSEIRNLKYTTFNSKKDGVYSWGMSSRFSYAQGERKYTFPTSDGGTDTVYNRPLVLWDSTSYTIANGSTYYGWVGYSQKFGWFGVMQNCGNLITKKQPPSPQPSVACTRLSVSKLDRTKFRFTAQASTKDGGKIKRYQFVVSTTPDNVVKQRIDVTTSNTSASTVYDSTLKPDTYKVRAWVIDSAGNAKTSSDCVDRFTITSPSVPGVSIDKKVDGVEHKVVGINTQFKYQIVVKNTGNTALENIVVSDKAPEGVTFLSASHGSITNNAWKYTIPTKIAIGGEQTFTITAKVPTYKAGTIRNTACVDAPAVSGNPDDCDDATIEVPVPPAPTAVCSGIKAVVANRTIVSLSGSAQTANGASVKQYTFVVKDAQGKVVKTVSVPSSELNVTADSFTLSTAGKYTVQLTVQTSLGDKTDTTNCVTSLQIVEPKKCPLNPELLAENPDCQPCPDEPSLWIKDEACSADIISTKVATNLTKDSEAATTVARASDRIQYTVQLTNQGHAPASQPIIEDLSDILEYASLTDPGDGTFNEKAKTLSWTAVTVKPGDTISRTFVVKLHSKIPAANTDISERTSYDCIMTNTFGNSINITVACPAVKNVEQVVNELPKTGPGENMLFGSVLLAVVVYFYARSRQLGKEVKLVRRDVHAGTI